MDAPPGFTAETFRAHVGTTFEVTDPALALVLTRQDDFPSGLRPGGSFSLFFVGPVEPLLPQATYELTHGELGPFDAFIVPVARTDAGSEYEAAFN
jgi:hypothetical protein